MGDLDRALAVESSRIKIRQEKRRYGKLVTILEGFDESLDLEPLARELKRFVGSGGTVRARALELQGDHAKTVRSWLEGRGFRLA